MQMTWQIWAVLALVVATGLVAGIFLTFSDFVMNGLRLSKPEAGIEAMQMINRTVYQSVFMVLFMGLTLISVLVLVYALLFSVGAATVPLVMGALVYLLGVFVVTAVFNVPMNTHLDGLEATSLEAARYWPDYYQRWTIWNHVRSIASLLAMVSFLAAALQLGFVA